MTSQKPLILNKCPLHAGSTRKSPASSSMKSRSIFRRMRPIDGGDGMKSKEATGQRNPTSAKPGLLKPEVRLTSLQKAVLAGIRRRGFYITASDIEAGWRKRMQMSLHPRPAEDLPPEVARDFEKANMRKD